MMRRLSFVFTRNVLRHLSHKSHCMACSTSRREKVVVIMGPTGCGKTKLSVDLASRFFPWSEIINSDKIQVYRGLDITTNKIPFHDRRNVTHHCIGEFDPSESHPEFTPSDFRAFAGITTSQILSRRRLPLIVGGSNSFIYALLATKYRPEIDVFSTDVASDFCREMRYNCCFISVNVCPPVLNRYLETRVDDMLESGMFEELGNYFADPRRRSQCGLEKAIGVTEFERYFRKFKTDWRITKTTTTEPGNESEKMKTREYEEAVRTIKANTLVLAQNQLAKIQRLRDAAGWNLKTVDATTSVMAAMAGERAAEIWEREVVEESVNIVKRFLMEEE